MALTYTNDKQLTEGRMMKRREQGFGAAAAALVILAVALATGLVYAYVSNKNAADQRAQADTQMSQRMAASDQALNTQRKNAASNLVKDAYDVYLAGFGSDDLEANRNAFLAHTTVDLAKQLTDTSAYDAIICAQNIPVSLTYGDVAVSGATAVETVTTHWGDASDTVAIKVTVDTDQNKITAISCPQNLVKEYVESQPKW